jgi:hypothetical protein
MKSFSSTQHTVALTKKTNNFFHQLALLPFRILVFLLIAILPFSAIGQVFCPQDPIPSAQLDLRSNPAYIAGQCPANDIQILGAELVQTGDLCNTCAPGTLITANLKITIHHNTNSDNRYLGVFADLTQTPLVGSPTICKIARCSGPVKKAADEVNGQQVLDYGQVTFTCGSQLTLSNILLVWTAANGECPVTLANNPNGKYCYANPSILITPPLNAVTAATCAPGNKANIDLTITGGSGNFSYLWSNGATTEDLSGVPLGTYTVTVTDNVKKDASGNPCKVTSSITFNGPCCEFFATCNLNLNLQTIEGCGVNALPAAFTLPSQVFTNITTNPCGILVLKHNDVTSGSLCPNGLSVVRTYTLFDDLNNNQILDAGEESATCVQNFKIVDTNAPVIDPLPGPSTINCPTTPVFATPTATDLCDASVALTFEDVTTAGNCPGNYSVTRTWTATDDCGNTSTASQTINVQDVTKPVIAALPGVSTIDCPTSPSFAQATASDDCDASVDLTFKDVTAPGNCPGNYSVTRTWTATDDCGNTSTASQTINVQDVTKPVIAALLGVSTIDCPATPVFATPTATDLCDASVALTFEDVTVPGNCPGNYSVTRTWTATDDCGNTSTASQTINVQDVTKPVIAALPGVSTIDCPTTPSFAQATASDDCDASVDLTFKDVTAPGNCPGNYSVTRTWTATDDCGNTSTASQTINVQDVTKPVIAALPGVSTIDCPAKPVFATPTATDLCDASVALTFEDVTVPGNCPGNYSVTRTWTATDDCGNTSTASQTINVQDVTKPVIAALPGVSTIDCPTTPSFAQATASDDCDASVDLTFKDVTAPGNCPGNYSVTRTWTATDDCGNTSTASQTINVQDVTKPVIAALPGVSTIDCPETPSFAQATASDDCDASVDLTFKDVTAPGNCPGNYSVTRTWTATDDCGNTSTASQTINVQDVTKPVIAALRGVSTIDCPATPVFATPTANDLCDASVALTFEDVTTPGNCPGNYSVTRTWTATDDCGNTSTASQTINVQDVTKPVIAALPGVSTIDCPATPSFAQATASDDCDASVDLTFKDVTAPGNCPGNYSVTRTWTATDDCGNTSTASQTINVQDVTKPVIAALPGVSTIDCPETPSFAQATASDDCDASVDLTFKDVTAPGNCPGNYSVTRTWTATDDCGNTSTASQTINVQDVTKPVIVALPAPSTIDCSTIPQFAQATAIDDCDASVTLTFNDVTTSGSCAGSYSITRTWTATDDCVNSSTAAQVINFTDSKAPVFTSVPANTSVDCSAVPVPGTPTATDDCSGVTVTYKGQIRVNGNCAGNYTLTRTWEAEDGCGNKATASQIITVTDTKAPVLIGTISNKTIDCEIPVVFATPTFSDCGPVTVTFVNVLPTGNACPKLFTRTWTATDDCGYSTTISQTIAVKCCPTICTYTNGFYGNANGKACTTTGTQVSSLTIMQNAMTAAGGIKDFGIVNANNRYFRLVNADFSGGTSSNIYKMLPGGGTSSAILGGSVFTSYANTSTWPRVPIITSGSKAGSINNILLAQTITMFFNLNLDNTLGNFQLLATGIITSPKASCGTPLPLARKDTFYIPQNVLNYLNNTGTATVSGLFDLANKYLGGFTVTGIPIGDVNKAVDAINRAFDICRAFRDYYSPITNTPIITSSFNSGKDIISTKKLVLKATAYPNPFNSFVEIRFTPPVEGKIMLEVYTLLGQRIYNDQKTIAGNAIGISDKFKITGQLPKAPMMYKLSMNGHTVMGKLFPISDQ